VSGWLPPALVLAAALTSTYLCCLRPLRGGACRGRPAGMSAAVEDNLDRQLCQEHLERDRLRAQ
jgi:hypothetical protein